MMDGLQQLWTNSGITEIRSSWKWSRRSVCFWATIQYLTWASAASCSAESRLLEYLGVPARRRSAARFQAAVRSGPARER